MRSPWMCRRSWLRASLLLWLVRSSRGPCVCMCLNSHCYCVHVCMLPYNLHTATALSLNVDHNAATNYVTGLVVSEVVTRIFFGIFSGLGVGTRSGNVAGHFG